MKYKNIFQIIIALLSIIITNISNAETANTKNNIPIPIELSVNDLNKLFSKDEIIKINTQLKDIYDETKVKIAVVTIPAKYLEEISGKDYSLKLTKNWQTKNDSIVSKKDKKLVFLIAGNKHDLKNRFVRFEASKQMSSDISDKDFEDIIKNNVVPELKRGNYFLAVTEGVNQVKIFYTDSTPVLIVLIIAFILGSIGFIFFVIFVIKKLTKLKFSKKVSSSYSKVGFNTSFGKSVSYTYDTNLNNHSNDDDDDNRYRYRRRSSDSDSSSDSNSSSDFSGSGSDSEW